MKLSYNWLRQYIDLKETPEKLGEILTDLGLEVEGIEEVETIPGGLKGLVIGEVLTCIKHPNADKLSLTTVSVGEEESLQIVCGAPNVAQGQKVVVATVGTMLHPTEGDPFKIKKGKIRGEASEGMICAEDEIGIGTDHDGIIVLPADVKIGSDASDYYNVESDIVFEIGLTPNRSDATSHIGVAKDLAAYYNYHYGGDGAINLPEMEDLKNGQNHNIEVEVLDQKGCPRFSGISLSNVKIGPSPEWMQKHLQSIGVRPISNVVDITNYVLHEIGQPLHAYDEDTINKRKIIVSTLPEGTEFVALDEKERKLASSDLAICDGEKKPIGLAGVFGGASTGVSDSTTNIFLEAAHFDAVQIRKTSTKFNLRTDAAKVFEKGSDPNNTVNALARAAKLMVDNAGASVSSDILDIYPEKIAPAQISVSLDKINERTGMNISGEELEKIFGALSMDIISSKDGSYTVEIPTNKADVTREADVIEEVLRIYGFNNVKIDNRITTAVLPTGGLSKAKLRNELASLFSNEGYHEMMGLSLIPSSNYGGTKFENHLVYVNNTSNIHLDIMRPEMMLSGLLSVAHNINRQQSDLRLFEIGRTYQKNEEHHEEEYITAFLSGSQLEESWLAPNESVDYFDIKRVANRICKRVGLDTYQTSEVDDERFSYGLKYHRGPKTIITFGEVSTAYAKKADVKASVFYLESNLSALHKIAKKRSIKTESIPKYPSSRRDLAFIVDEKVSYDHIKAVAHKAGGKLLSEVTLFDVYKDASQLGEGKKSYAIAMTFVDPESNLKDKQIDKIIGKIVSSMEKQYSAKLRG